MTAAMPVTCQWSEVSWKSTLLNVSTLPVLTYKNPAGYSMYCVPLFPIIQCRHNGRESVSNHQLHDCLLNHLFRHRPKKTSKLRVTGLCAGNSPASNAEKVSIWWRHHEVDGRLISKPCDLDLHFSNRSKIWQAAGQCFCRSICRISKPNYVSNAQFRGLKASSGVTIKNFTAYCNTRAPYHYVYSCVSL